MKINRGLWLSLMLLIFPMLCIAEPIANVIKPCSQLQFYVANCEPAHLLKQINSHCDKGELALINEIAFPHNFIAFTLANDEKNPQDIQCQLSIALAKGKDLVAIYNVEVEASANNKKNSCDVTVASVTENKTKNKATYYQKEVIKNHTKYLLGICNGSLKSCQCPPI